MLWHGKNFRGIINKAKQMIFDNTGTDLISTNAEDAIKEVNSNLSNKIKFIETTITINSSSTVQPFSGYGVISLSTLGINAEQIISVVPRGGDICTFALSQSETKLAVFSTTTGDINIRIFYWN